MYLCCGELRAVISPGDLAMYLCLGELRAVISPADLQMYSTCVGMNY